MRDETRTQAWFLRDPRCRKWILQCSACRLFGSNPAAPASVPKYRFEEVFPIMELDELGVCQHCRVARR